MTAFPISDAVSSLTGGHRQADGRHFTGIHQINKVLASIIKSASEVWSVCPDLPAGRYATWKRSKDDFFWDGNPHRKLRVVLAAERAQRKELLDFALEEDQAHVRVAPHVPARIVIADRRLALVATNPRDYLDCAELITSQGVVSSLATLAQALWESAAPVKPVPHDGSCVVRLSAFERSVVIELAAGRTDQAVARRLSVSERTVARAVARLMERFRARSRFELATRLVEAGALSPDSAVPAAATTEC